MRNLVAAINMTLDWFCDHTVLLPDEFQLCVHPAVAGSALPLFENINNRTTMKLVKTKTFRGGAVKLYYEPVINDHDKT